MKNIMKIKDIIYKSWFLIPFYINNSVIKTLFRIKYSPFFLYKIRNSDLYSKVLSEINVWWFFKTVSYKRHNIWDKEIEKLIWKIDRKIKFADIWCSDGSASISLYEKMKDKFEKYELFDYYNYLKYKSYWPIKLFFNKDNYLVYIKFLFILLYVNKKINIKDNNIKYINFWNPELQKHWLEINEFNIINDNLKEEYDIVKCANLLHLNYFSKENILNIVKNKISQYIKNWWYLVLIHNNNKYNQNEAVIILKKNDNWEFEIYKNINNYEIIDLFD